MAGRRGFQWDQVNSRLEIHVDGTEALRFTSSAVTIVGGIDLTFAGTTGQPQINLTDNLADALSIKVCGGNDLLTFATTNCSERVAVVPTGFSIGGVAYTWPGADGSCGQQLTTNGCATLSWAAASTRESKTLHHLVCRQEAYETVVRTPVWDFTFKPEIQEKSQWGCFTHHMTGIVADEAPWAMQGKYKTAFSPINSFGMLTAAFQGLAERLEALEANERSR